MGAKDSPKGSQQMGVISFFLGLIGGTGGSIITKILFTMQAEGVNGDVKPFEVIIPSCERVTNRGHIISVPSSYFSIYCASFRLTVIGRLRLLRLIVHLWVPCDFRNLCSLHSVSWTVKMRLRSLVGLALFQEHPSLIPLSALLLFVSPGIYILSRVLRNDVCPSSICHY